MELASVEDDDLAGPLDEVEQGQARCPRVEDANRGWPGFSGQGPGQVDADTVVTSEHVPQPDDEDATAVSGVVAPH